MTRYQDPASLVHRAATVGRAVVVTHELGHPPPQPLHRHMSLLLMPPTGLVSRIHQPSPSRSPPPPEEPPPVPPSELIGSTPSELPDPMSPLPPCSSPLLVLTPFFPRPIQPPLPAPESRPAPRALGPAGDIASDMSAVAMPLRSFSPRASMMLLAVITPFTLRRTKTSTCPLLTLCSRSRFLSLSLS